MSNNPIRVGIAGFGAAAQFMHAPFISTMEGYQLRSVLERHGEKSREKYPFVSVVRDIDQLVGQPDLDLIIITTPNETHLEFAKKAMLAGKHVVVEKPFTITCQDAAELIALSKSTQRILSVYQNRRYVCDFLTVKKILAEGLLGEIVEYEAHYDRYRPEAKPNAWRELNTPGSGIFYDLGSHLIDQALFLFGLPKSITADLRIQRPHAKVNDYFDIRLDYGFTVVILKSGMLVREPGPRFMIHGTLGSFIKYGEEPQEVLLRAGQLPTGVDWGIEPESQWGLLHTVRDGKLIKEKYPSLKGSFGMFYDNLYQTIVHGSELREKPEHGFNTIRVIELAMQSSLEKRSVSGEGFIQSDYQ